MRASLQVPGREATVTTRAGLCAAQGTLALPFLVTCSRILLALGKNKGRGAATCLSNEPGHVMSGMGLWAQNWVCLRSES